MYSIKEKEGKKKQHGWGLVLGLATGQLEQGFPRTNAELVPKFHVAPHAPYAFPMLRLKIVP
jgi:hypothetical protein